MSAPTEAQRAIRKSERESLELAFLRAIKVASLPLPFWGLGCEQPQLHFAANRRWAFDFAWDHKTKLAVEVEGGIYQHGRHTRGSGFEADCEKTNEAQILGWTVLRVTRRHIESGEAVGWIRRALGVK